MVDQTVNLVFRAQFERADAIQKGMDGMIGDVKKRAKEAGVAVGDMSASINDATGRVNVMVRSQKRFRFELLSTMFAGMALSRWMSQHTKRVQKMTGATTLHEAAMTSALIPAQLSELNILGRLQESFDYWVLSLDEGGRTMVGLGIMGTQALGNILMTLSQVGLAWQGLEKLGLTKVLTRPIGAVKGIAGTFAGLFGGMGTKGQANLPNTKGMGKLFTKFTKNFTKLFKTMGTKLAELSGSAIGLTSYVFDGIQWLGAALYGVISGVATWIGKLVGDFSIVSAVTGIGKKVVDFFKWVGGKLGVSNFVNWVTSGISILGGKIVEFFTWLGSKTGVSKFLDWITTGIAVLGGKIVEFFTWLGAKTGVSKFVDWITSGIAILGGKIVEFFTWLGAKTGVTKFADWITSGIAILGGKIVEFFGWVAAKLGLSTAASGVAAALTAIGTAIKALFAWVATQIGLSAGGSAGAGIAAKLGLGAAAGGAAGGIGGGLAAAAPPIAIGTAITAAIKESFERLGVSGGLGAGWYWMAKQGEIRYMTMLQAALEGQPHYKIGEPATPMPSLNSLDDARKLMGKYGKGAWAEAIWDYYVARLPNAPKPPDALAKGGIVKGPMNALIGEAGPEAVIPLDQFGELGRDTYVEINVDARIADEFDLTRLAERIAQVIQLQNRSATLV